MTKNGRRTIGISIAAIASVLSGTYLLKSCGPQKAPTVTSRMSGCLADNLKAVRAAVAKDSALAKFSDVKLDGTILTTYAEGNRSVTTLDLGSPDQTAVYQSKSYTAAEDQSAYFSGRFIDLPKPEQATRAIANRLITNCPSLG